MLSPHISIQRPSTDLGSGRSGSSRKNDLGKGTSNQGIQHQQSPTNHGPTLPNPPRPREISSAPSSPRNSAGLIYNHDAIIIKWPEKPIDKAPELAIVTKRPSVFQTYSGDCISKLFRVIAGVCKTFNRVGDSALANFRPVDSRTEHTLEYVNDLAREYIINLKYGSQPHIGGVIVKTPSGTTIKSDHADPKSLTKVPSSNTKQKQSTQQTVKLQLLKEFYEKSYRTLSVLQQCIGHFRTIIYTLTFTRYAEEDLTDSEAKLVLGKSAIGSCIWLVTCALQQLQDDPELEQSEYTSKSNPDLVELGLEMQSLVSLSLHAWHDILIAIAALERVHRRTEEVFHKQTNSFCTKSKPESEAASIAGYHSRQYRRPPHGDTQQLRNFKGFDPYASLMTWTNKRQGPCRILYMSDYTNPASLWLGFDTLSVDKKIPYLKDIMHFIKLVFASVREIVKKITADLHGHELTSSTLHASHSPTPHYTGIATYEDGLEVMDDILTKKLEQYEWNCDEMHEFFDTDKIFLDDMDLLTLAATITRTIVFEARHILHVCYETCRLLDYKEFMSLPSFEKIYRKVKESYGEDHPAHSYFKFGKRGLKGSLRSTLSQYDTDETHIELRNVAGLFRTSHYREILKNLPVYTNNIGMTLQDPEMVFSPSSEKLLS